MGSSHETKTFPNSRGIKPTVNQQNELQTFGLNGCLIDSVELLFFFCLNFAFGDLNQKA